MNRGMYMKIMKKIFKNSILTFVLGVILAGSISVYAAGRYYATQVDYEPSNPNFNVDNMSDALDQLYTTQNTTVNSLNSQITAKDQTISNLNSQVSTKDVTISSLTSELNNINANNCFKGSITSNQSSTTSTGQTILNFVPSILIWNVGELEYQLEFPNGINNFMNGYNVNLKNGTISGPYKSSTYLTSHSVKSINGPQEYVGIPYDLIACK